MGVFSGCLLISDIDGTLLENNIIPENNLKAIEYFKSEGGFFTVATGRGPTVGIPIAKRLNVNAPVLFSNGSVIYDVWNNKPLYADYLSDECKEVVAKTVQKFPLIGAEVTLMDKIITLNDNDTTRRHRKYDGFSYIPSTPNEAFGCDWIKTLFMTNDNSLLSEVKRYMNTIKPASAEYIVTSPIYYEVHVGGINKAVNIPKLLKILNISPKKVFTIGDYYNDIELVKAGAIGAFTENSPDDIKGYADYITTNVQNGAVADFINYLGGIGKWITT